VVVADRDGLAVEVVKQRSNELPGVLARLLRGTLAVIAWDRKMAASATGSGRSASR
jgi:hypothetical protein